MKATVCLRYSRTLKAPKMGSREALPNTLHSLEETMVTRWRREPCQAGTMEKGQWFLQCPA